MSLKKEHTTQPLEDESHQDSSPSTPSSNRMISDELWGDLLHSPQSSSNTPTPSTGTFSAVHDASLDGPFPQNSTSPEIHPLRGTMQVDSAGLQLGFQLLDSPPAQHLVSWDSLALSVKQALSTLLQHKDPDNTQERDLLLGRIFYTLLTQDADPHLLKALQKADLPATIHFEFQPPTPSTPPKTSSSKPKRTTRSAPLHIESEHEDLVQLELEADEAIQNGDTRAALTTIQTTIQEYRNRSDAFGVARCLIRGSELLMTGDTYHKTASDWLQAASSTYQNAPSSHQRDYWSARASYNLCRLLSFQNQWEDTRSTIDTIFDQTNELDPDLLTKLLLLRADAHQALQNTHNEREDLLEALEELQHSNLPSLLLTTHMRLASLFEREHNTDARHAHLAAALRIAYSTNSTPLIVSISETLAHTAEETGNLELAWDYAGRAFPHLDDLQDHAHILRFFVLLLRIAPGVVDDNTLKTLIHHATPILDAIQASEQKIELVGYLVRANQTLRTQKLLTPILPHLDECISLICEHNSPTESLKALSNGLAHITFYCAQHLENLKNFSTAHRLFKSTISLFTWTEHTAQALEAMCGVARCNVFLDREEEALQLFEDILEQAQDLNVPPVLLSAHLGLAQLYNRRGELSKVTQFLLRTISLQETLPNPLPLGITYIQLADIELDRAEIALARSTLHKPRQIFDSKTRGTLLLASETLRKSLGEATRFLSQARNTLGPEHSKQNGFYLSCQGRIHFLYGEFDTALQTLEDAIASTPARNEPTISVSAACRLAETLAILQRFNDAHETLNLAREVAHTFGSEEELVILQRYEGRVLFIEGTHLRKALKSLNNAIKDARKLSNQRITKTMLLEPYLTREALKTIQIQSSPSNSSLGRRSSDPNSSSLGRRSSDPNSSSLGHQTQDTTSSSVRALFKDDPDPSST